MYECDMCDSGEIVFILTCLSCGHYEPSEDPLHDKKCTNEMCRDQPVMLLTGAECNKCQEEYDPKNF